MKKIVLILILNLLQYCISAQNISQCDVDVDGDGISGCFDKCPDTPNGVTVDSHGCPIDTDADGVADYADKQLITPTECQPVDQCGIGLCPCNCPEQTKAYVCGAAYKPVSVYFPPNITHLAPYAIKF